MLYWFHLYLGINILQYITVRAEDSLFIGLLLTLFMPRLSHGLNVLPSKVQPINEYVSAHQSKAKTPRWEESFLLALPFIASLLTVNIMNPFAIGGLLTLVFYAYIGFTDDWGKIRGGDNLAGLSARAKLALQLVFGLAIGAFLYLFTKTGNRILHSFCYNKPSFSGVFQYRLLGFSHDCHLQCRQPYGWS